MTPREIAAFNAGVEAVRQITLLSAVTIEARHDARKLRQQAAAAALHGLADGARTLVLPARAACSSPDINREADPAR